MNGEELKEWRRWLVGGIALLVLLAVALIMLMCEVVSRVCEEDSCPPKGEQPSASIVVDIENMTLGGSETGAGAEPLAEPVENLADAIATMAKALTPPIRLEIAHDFVDSELIGNIHQTLQAIAKGRSGPLQVEVLPASGCGEGNCPPSIFVAGDLQLSSLQGAKWVVKGQPCQLGWVGRVCGFPPGEADGEGAESNRLVDSLNRVGEKLTRSSAADRLKWLVLIGRTDRMNFADSSYGGNRGLAEARAAWVRKELRSGELEGISEVLEERTMLLGAGPLNVPKRCDRGGTDCDEREREADRAVDVFACVVPARSREYRKDGEERGQEAGTEGNGECGGVFGLK